MADATNWFQDPDLRSRLLRAMDDESRIPAALEALGPVADRDVAVLDPDDRGLAPQLLKLGGWVRALPNTSLATLGAVPDGRADVLVAGWSAFQPGSSDWDEHLASARRMLRSDGRLLVVHDYGRDEVTALLGDEARAAQLMRWSRPSGPFLGVGFRIRVLHCWWRWETQADATELLIDAFGETGAVVAAGMRRPRLAWKVAVYHLGMQQPEADGATPAARPKSARAARSVAVDVVADPDPVTSA